MIALKEHLVKACEGKKNYRNGTVKRTMKTQLGEVDVNVPRDRNGEFEPQIIGKYQRNADGIEERILSLYATGMSTRDIKDQIKGLYDVEISEGLVSKISERILPEAHSFFICNWNVHKRYQRSD